MRRCYPPGVKAIILVFELKHHDPCSHNAWVSEREGVDKRSLSTGAKGGEEGYVVFVRVGNLCGIFQCINALLVVFEVPHGRSFDIPTVRPCLSARAPAW
jgi:hypothetical protein